MNNLNSLWTITTYFNPAGYHRRYKNFKVFRKHLTTKLLVVELSHDGEFALDNSDADVVIRLSSSCILWQKERLLNVAIAHLPKEVQSVAWVDCDVIFLREDWADAVEAALQEVPLCQPFSVLYEPGPDVDPFQPIAPAAYSLAYKSSTDALEALKESTVTSDPELRAGGGFAWAARKELLDKCGIYDALILGGGDRALSGAAYGRFQDPVRYIALNAAQAKHYLSWASGFHHEVRGQVGFVEGGLVHLWHGDLANRRYIQRHVDMAVFCFDPDADIAIGHNGCWEWNSSKPDLRAYVKQYFRMRNED